jgi:hypothetical protein
MQPEYLIFQSEGFRIVSSIQIENPFDINHLHGSSVQFKPIDCLYNIIYCNFLDTRNEFPLYINISKSKFCSYSENSGILDRNRVTR